MEVYRITRSHYANDLTGEGAKRYGGRWNHKGNPMLYTSAHISLAFLELLVNADQFMLSGEFSVVTINVPDDLPAKKFQQKKLPENWRTYDGKQFSMDFGTEWLNKNKEPVLVVPSAVIPFELNYLVNPQHPIFSKIKVKKVLEFEIDRRFRLSRSSEEEV